MYDITRIALHRDHFYDVRNVPLGVGRNVSHQFPPTTSCTNLATSPAALSFLCRLNFLEFSSITDCFRCFSQYVECLTHSRRSAISNQLIDLVHYTCVRYVTSSMLRVIDQP